MPDEIIYSNAKMQARLWLRSVLDHSIYAAPKCCRRPLEGRHKDIKQIGGLVGIVTPGTAVHSDTFMTPAIVPNDSLRTRFTEDQLTTLLAFR